MASKGQQSASKSRLSPEEEGSTILRLSQARDIVTELARYIAIVEKDPSVREDLYFRLIESLDFSAEWHGAAARKKLGELYIDLTQGWWGDEPKKKSSGFWEGEDE